MCVVFQTSRWTLVCSFGLHGEKIVQMVEQLLFSGGRVVPSQSLFRKLLVRSVADAIGSSNRHRDDGYEDHLCVGMLITIFSPEEEEVGLLVEGVKYFCCIGT